MSEVEQKETEYVAGAIEGIIQKGPDKWQVAVKPVGAQWVKNLWTKDSELVAALSQKIGQSGAFTCNVSHWTNQEGKPVRSLWIEGETQPSAITSEMQQAAEDLSRIAVATPSESVQTQWGGAPNRYSDEEVRRFEDKERRDYRSRAWAQTLGAFTHTIKVDEDPVEVFQRLQPFQRKVFQDVCQSFAFPGDESDVPF